MFKRQQHDRRAASTPSPQARRAQLEEFLEAARHDEGLGPGDGRIPVPLKRGERMLFTVQGVALVEPRRDRGHWEGRNQGVSVHVPGTRSMRYRIGSTHGTYVQGTEQPTVIDTGTFTITTQRACFSGAKQTREWAWSKLVGVTHDTASPWSAISVSNRQKTSGILYDREHTDLIRFWLDLAIARATDNAPMLINQLEGELATLGPAPPAAGVTSSQLRRPRRAPRLRGRRPIRPGGTRILRDASRCATGTEASGPSTSRGMARRQRIRWCDRAPLYSTVPERAQRATHAQSDSRERMLPTPTSSTMVLMARTNRRADDAVLARPDLVSRYPLTGIRAATTEPQWRLVEHAVEVLSRDDRVLAIWLVGSLATGGEDPWSDIDLHCCVTDETVEALRDGGWRHLVDAITPTVLTSEFHPGAIGGYCITPEWVHLDLAPVGLSQLRAERVEGMRPLFDRTGELLPDGPVPRPPLEGEPYYPTTVVEWFFYMFGNLAVVVGRNEPVLATNAVVTIRDTCLVPLFMAERGISRAGGNKRQRPFLSAEQYTLLEGLPPILTTIDSAIDCELALARVFITRGRTLATATGSAWPEALEAATLQRVEDALGLRPGSVL